MYPREHLLRVTILDRVVDDERGLVDDATPAFYDRSELGERAEARPMANLGHTQGVLEVHGPLLTRDGQDSLHVDAVVPDVEWRHRSEFVHALPVPAHGALDRRRARAFLDVEVASRHGDARREAFDVPFPRSRERLVEVVDVEDEVPLGCCEHAEVGEVCVTTRLHTVASHRGAGKVVGHELRRTAKEREGRDQHPLVAHGHEVRDAGRVRRLETRHWIGPSGIGLPPCVP